MAVGMKQSLNLSQTLRMTPQLQQAIKLLQLSRMELETAVRKELEENPVLEESPDEGPEQSAQTDTPQAQAESQAQDQDPQKHDEFDWENYIDTQYKPPQSTGGGNEEIMNYENVITTTQTLYDHLMWQMSLHGFNDEEAVIAGILISYIDDDGYIKVPLSQIAIDENVPEEELASILPFVQEFDPPGVGARDLKECLMVQAKHLQEDTHDFTMLINNHLKDLEKKNYEGIAKAMGRELEEIIEMCKIIYTMDPKPGRAYMSNDTQFVTPDVYVYKVGDDYMVSLNEDGLPRLRISNFYRNVLQGGGNNNTQEYIQEKLRSAVWLIKSIHQRQRTIYKVAESIVKHQKDFFEKGPGFIKPMIFARYRQRYRNARINGKQGHDG